MREITGVPVSTLHGWAAKRERGIDAPGPHYVRLGGRDRRWTRRDVYDWLESARV
ncbi:DNA-binding protein [Mycobacterium tuberculosis]|nr:DNA-binding protein [Mycobacterium tuberculosis]